MQPQSGSDVLVQLIPLLLTWLIAATIAWRIARQKGVRLLWVIVGLFPLWFAFAALYWASLTDKDVLDRLARLEDTSH